MLDYEPEAGIPPDGPRLGPAIERIIAAVGATPDAVTADRCYGLASVDAHLEDLDVDLVAIPRKGQPCAARRKPKPRTGSSSWSSGAPPPKGG